MSKDGVDDDVHDDDGDGDGDIVDNPWASKAASASVPVSVVVTSTPPAAASVAAASSTPSTPTPTKRRPSKKVPRRQHQTQPNVYMTSGDSTLPPTMSMYQTREWREATVSELVGEAMMQVYQRRIKIEREAANGPPPARVAAVFGCEWPEEGADDKEGVVELMPTLVEQAYLFALEAFLNPNMWELAKLSNGEFGCMMLPPHMLGGINSFRFEFVPQCVIDGINRANPDIAGFRGSSSSSSAAAPSFPTTFSPSPTPVPTLLTTRQRQQQQQQSTSSTPFPSPMHVTAAQQHQQTHRLPPTPEQIQATMSFIQAAFATGAISPPGQPRPPNQQRRS